MMSWPCKSELVFRSGLLRDDYHGRDYRFKTAKGASAMLRDAVEAYESIDFPKCGVSRRICNVTGRSAESRTGDSECRVQAEVAKRRAIPSQAASGT